MKTFIIVDPFSTGSLLAPEINSKGHTVYSVLSNSEIADFYTSSYTGNGFSNKNIMSLQEAQNKFQYIDGVIIGSESGVIAGEQLAEYFNVKGNSTVTTLFRRDKYLMHKILKDNQLNYIKSYEITKENYKEIITTLEKNKSYVIKPKSSAGTDGVIYFDNPSNLLEYVNDKIWQKKDIFGKLNTSYLIQEYISGTEYVIDMVADGDEIFIASLCRYEKGRFNDSEFVYKSLEVLDPNAPEYQSLIEYAIQCAKCLDIKYGPIHMELFNNTQNEPVMIEVGARLHGGIAPLLFKECYKNNLLDTTVNYFIENKLPQEKSAKLIKNGKIVFLINTQKDALFQNEEIFKISLSKLASFSGVKLFFEKDQAIPLTTDLTNIPGIVWLSHSNQEQIDNDEKIIRDLFFSQTIGESNVTV